MATTEPNESSATTTTETGLISWGPTSVVAVITGFWAVWWSMVFATNFFDGLITLGVLGEGWSFASGNYGFLVSIMEVHGTPEPITAAVFAGGVLWELVAAVLMWQALAGSLGGFPSERIRYRAFAVTIGFFAAFLVMTEVFLAYDLAGTHVRLFTAAGVSLVVVEYLLSTA